MRPVLDPTGHRVPWMKPTCLLHTWRPHRQRPFVLVLHLHQHESSRNLHLQYLAKNQSTQHCLSLITPGSDHPLVLEPHMALSSSFHHAARTRPRWPPSPSSRAYLSLHSSEARQGIDLSCSLFTCTNANEAATCTCNTWPRVSPHHVVNHSSQPWATIHLSSDVSVLNHKLTYHSHVKLLIEKMWN
jgi:hypothetical protein